MITYKEIVRINPSGKRCWLKVEINGEECIIKKKVEEAKRLIEGSKPTREDEILARVSKISQWDRIKFYIKGLFGKNYVK